jgi:uncharacterized membrane protein YgcG
MTMLLKRYFAYRRLKPIVSILPRRLMRAFGSDEHCTFLQAKRAISDLRLSQSQEPYALAAACRFPELERNSAPLSAEDYRRLRAELVDLFDIRRTDFTLKDLLATPYASHSPGLDNLNATVWARWIAQSWGGAYGVSGAGMHALSGHGWSDSGGGSGHGSCDGGGSAGGDGGGC